MLIENFKQEQAHTNALISQFVTGSQQMLVGEKCNCCHLLHKMLESQVVKLVYSSANRLNFTQDCLHEVVVATLMPSIQNAELRSLILNNS